MKFISRSEAPDVQIFDSEFSKLPDQVRKESYRKGLFPDVVWQSFLKMPFSKPREFWILKSGEETVGRVGANISATYPGFGYVGFFEYNLSHPLRDAQTLLRAATDWLKSQGTHTVFGPMNYNTWFPYRFRTSAEDSWFFAFEPVNPTEYVHMWTSEGFVPVETYQSYAIDSVEFIKALEPSWRQTQDSGFRVREFDRQSLLTKEVPILYRISMECFKQNFLFEPISLEAFQALYVPLADRMESTASFFLLNEKEQEVGFSFSFAEQGHTVVKTLALMPEARGKGASNGLTYWTCKTAFERFGTQSVVTAMIKTGAQSQSYAKKSTLKWVHEYQLFKKEI